MYKTIKIKQMKAHNQSISIRICLMAIASFIVICSSCSKSKDTGETNTADTTTNNNSVTYTFSAPVSVATVSARSGYGTQTGFVTMNHIYQRAYLASVGGYTPVFYKDNNVGYFIISFPGVPGSYNSLREITSNVGPFCIDKEDKFLYSVFNVSGHGMTLFKCDISSASTATLVAYGIEASLIKVLGNGDILYASGGNGGSLYILKSGSTTPTALATNLGAAPAAIDVYNNEIYFTLNLSSGKVQKISSSGTVSTVVDNLTNPSRLVFDNNGNMVVETKTTIDGGDYGKYTIYSNSGSKIAEISDDQNISILSALGSESAVPLCIDNYNNLYFGHYDYISTSSVNHSNPFINGSSDLRIFKMQLIKK